MYLYGLRTVHFSLRGEGQRIGRFYHLLSGALGNEDRRFASCTQRGLRLICMASDLADVRNIANLFGLELIEEEEFECEGTSQGPTQRDEGQGPGPRVPRAMLRLAPRPHDEARRA